MKIKRVTLDGSVTAVTFDGIKCGKWIVKNFTESDIFVSFSETLDESKSAKISAGYGQVVIENEYLGILGPFEHDTLYIKGTGEVEVQAVCFH